MPRDTDSARVGDWNWNGKRKLAAQMRAEGKPWAEIAKATGYTLDTAHDLAKVPAFRERVEALSDAIVEDALVLVKATAREAAEKVLWVMRHGQARRDEPQLAAAQDVLDRLGVAFASADPEPGAATVINVGNDAILLAEQALLAALEGQRVVVGDAVYPGTASDARAYPLPALPVPGPLPDGPRTGADRPQGTADGYEPDDRA